MGGNAGSQLSTLLAMGSPQAKLQRLEPRETEGETEDASQISPKPNNTNTQTTLLQQILNGQGKIAEIFAF